MLRGKVQCCWTVSSMMQFYGTRIQRRPRSERAVRASHAHRLSNSQAQTQKAENQTCYIPQNQTLRQGLEGNFRFPRPCRWVVWRITLTRKLTVRQAMPCNSAHSLCKSHRIGQFATECVLPIVESERLLIHIAEQVKRLNCNVGSTEATLQTAPKVFDS